MAFPIHMLGIAARSSPKTIGRWVLRKLKARRTARRLPKWERWHSAETIAGTVGAKDFTEVVSDMRGANPFPGLKRRKEIRTVITRAQSDAIDRRATLARNRQVDMLGSGLVQLGVTID